MSTIQATTKAYVTLLCEAMGYTQPDPKKNDDLGVRASRFGELVEPEKRV